MSPPQQPVQTRESNRSGTNASTLRIEVLVPTYRRPADLARCLRALASQTRPADAVVVAVRKEDEESLELLRAWASRSPLKLAGVTSHGVVTALNAGLAELKCDIVAITDDDAAPRPEWLARIETHFMQNADVGGVGGRDWVVGEQQAPERTLVGRVQWFGRVVGNHHLGVGGVRDVDILKGVNMSFRTEALAGILFDVNLRGQGAQVWNEMALSFEVKRKGYRLIYDPAIAVDHFPSRRHDYDQRTRFDRLASIDRAFNKFWVFLRCMPRGPRRISALSWELIVGTRDEPGLVHLVTGILRREHTTVERWKCAQLGRKAALEEMRRARQQRR